LKRLDFVGGSFMSPFAVLPVWQFPAPYREGKLRNWLPGAHAAISHLPGFQQTEARITGFVNLTLTTRADGGEDFVWANAQTRHE